MIIANAPRITETVFRSAASGIENSARRLSESDDDDERRFELSIDALFVQCPLCCIVSGLMLRSSR